jgi:hypothetical protein
MIDKALLAKIKAWFGAVAMSCLALLLLLMLLTTPVSEDWIVILWFNLSLFTPFAIYYTWRLKDPDTTFWSKISSSLLLSILFALVLSLHLSFGIFGCIKFAEQWGYEVEDFKEISIVLSDSPTYTKKVRYNKYTGLLIQESIHLPQQQYADINFNLPNALVEVINHERITQQISAGDSVLVTIHQKDIRSKIYKTEESDFLDKTGIAVYGITANGHTYIAFNEETLDTATSKSLFVYFILIGFFLLLPIYLMYRIVINRRKYNQQNPPRVSQ